MIHLVNSSIMIDTKQYQLSSMESNLLEIIHEYLENNRTFNLEKIIPFINHRTSQMSIDINNKGIKIVLESLLKKKLIVEGSKLTQEEILKNKKRRKILEFILNNPGANFNKIVKTTDICNHLVAWHLNMLIKFGIINKTQLKNEREIYFSQELEPDQAVKLHFLSKKKCKRIFQYIKKDDMGVLKTHLVDNLNFHPHTIEKYLNILLEFQLVVMKKESNKTLYFLND